MGRDLAVVADARDRLRHRIGILVDGKNLGALAREQHRRGAAVAPARPNTAGAADQRYFSFESSRHAQIQLAFKPAIDWLSLGTISCFADGLSPPKYRQIPL